MKKSTENSPCPVCGESKTIFVIERESLITMQNYVYRDREQARKARVGRFELCACENCGFAFNAQFDPGLMSYDENYDNQVPSKLFLDYYEKIARFLYEKYELEDKLVVEIGCGKGTFLKTLCSLYPRVSALGIDPSYESPEFDESPNNPTFIQDVFKQEYLEQSPALVICRHVLEHIYDPVSFLRSIYDTVKDYPETPFFIEVPDLEWIVENNVFWDFCYEHCNYFTLESLQNTLRLAGFSPLEVDRSFGGQYLWVGGVIRSGEAVHKPGKAIFRQLTTYSLRENMLMKNAETVLRRSKAIGNIIVVWGMATKGVVFCNLIDPKFDLIDYCIDINLNKQNCFVPNTAHLIRAPESLREIDSSAAVTIVVMNPNYLSEIKDECTRFGIDAIFIDAAGKAY